MEKKIASFFCVLFVWFCLACVIQIYKYNKMNWKKNHTQSLVRFAHQDFAIQYHLSFRIRVYHVHILVLKVSRIFLSTLYISLSVCWMKLKSKDIWSIYHKNFIPKWFAIFKVFFYQHIYKSDLYGIWPRNENIAKYHLNNI